MSDKRLTPVDSSDRDLRQELRRKRDGGMVGGLAGGGGGGGGCCGDGAGVGGECAVENCTP